MTIPEVMEEMRKHLDERTEVEDNLVLTSTWRHLVDPEMSCDMFKNRVRAQPGGTKLWAEYTQTVRQRREAFKAALRQAAAEKRSVYAVARLWGVKIDTDYLRMANIVPWGHTFDVEGLRQQVRPGMSISELAKKTGYCAATFYEWVRNGKLESVCKVIRQPLPIGIGFKWVVSEVVSED